MLTDGLCLGSRCSGHYAATGGGQVLECLRQHRDELSDACRTEELHLNILQARDVRLRPKLRKICAHEMTTHCKEVKPGAPPSQHVLILSASKCAQSVQLNHVLLPCTSNWNVTAPGSVSISR